MSKEELYMKYRNLIFKAIKDLNCQFKNDDEFQEYYDIGEIGLLKAINSYNPKIDSSSTFFYISIVNNIKKWFYLKMMGVRYINYIQKISFEENSERSRILEDLIPNNVNIEKEYIIREQNEILYKAIDKLKSQYKYIVTSFYGIKTPKKTYLELSKELKISRQAIAVKKNTALKQLKKHFEELGGIYYD